jgi:hypothetical protein
MISATKDLMASKAAKAYLSNYISRYGEVQDFKIDSRRRRIDIVCQLNGEPDAIAVTVEKYQIEECDSKKYLQVLDTSATRPWLQAVMRDHLHGRRFELPSWAVAVL